MSLDPCIAITQFNLSDLFTFNILNMRFAQPGSLENLSHLSAKAQLDYSDDEESDSLIKAPATPVHEPRDQSHKAAGLILIIACLLLTVALTCLPLVLFSPHQFNLFFSTGSGLVHVALALFYGPRYYVATMFKRENLLVSALYMGSLALAVYTSILWGTYLSGLLVLLI